jgi:hypothetical protein
MQNRKPNHPTEDELERFVLNRSADKELEELETHILACDACITRLEDLEVQISATKIALQDIRQEQLAKAALPKENKWKSWFTTPEFSLTGAVAAVALGLVLIPVFLPHRAPVAQVSLSAYRGEETSIVPTGHRLEIHLNTTDLTEGPVLVTVVNIRGMEVWKGSTAIHHEQADIEVPPIADRGEHFLRLYAPNQANSESDLLREFAFQVH